MAMKLTDQGKEEFMESEGRRCPNGACNGMNLTSDQPNHEGGSIYIDMSCEDCKSSWTVRYDMREVIERD